MRILLVFPFLPYPPDDGGKIGFFDSIKYLSRKHEVAVLCLKDGHDQPASVAELKKYCGDLQTYERPTWQDPYRLLKGLFFSPPGSASKYWYPAAGQLLQRAITAHKPEIVEFQHLNTAAYRKFAGAVPTVLREHNVEYKLWERFAENASGRIERTYAEWMAPRIQRYEAEAASQFDQCIVVSQADAEHLRAISPTAQVEAIPLGVDTEYFYPSPDVAAEPYLMVFTGGFNWRPRQHNLRVILQEVMPRIRANLPEARLNIVGKGMPEDLRTLAEHTPGVTVTGAVPDVRPYIRRSSLALNYVESGGGIALKVLEAMAMRKPVLCNSLACEGIPVLHGRDIFVADGPDNFASAAAYLLENEPVRTGIAENAYLVALEKYSWNRLALELTICYSRILERRERGMGLSRVGAERVP